MRSVIFIRPTFSYNLFGGLLVPSIIFGFAQDFGDAKRVPGSAYSYIEVEPRVQINFAPGAYAALAYYWRVEQRFGPPSPPEQYTQWFNLRAGITF